MWNKFVSGRFKSSPKPALRVEPGSAIRPDTLQPASLSSILTGRLAKYNLDSVALGAFGEYLDKAGKFELYRLNPRRVAIATGLELPKAIEIAVLSVSEGIFDLLWQFMCLACGMEMQTFHNLADAPHTARVCQACHMTQEPDFDNHIQVVFTLNRAIYDLKMPSLEVKGPEGQVPTTLEEFRKFATPPQLELLQAIEKLADEHHPLTGLELVHNQFFRDFYKDQVLPVNVSLRVTRVSLIFTDLRGSTAMYAARGDPAAFELVSEHFQILTDVTNQHHGIVVKTVGDAVMASFLREVDAAQAAITFQQRIADFNLAHKLSPQNALVLKVGLHSGPCLSVTLNGVMDYFGTTVNMAARVGGLSKGGDVVVSAATLAVPQVREIFSQSGFTASQSMLVQLRGLPEQTEVYSYVPAK